MTTTKGSRSRATSLRPQSVAREIFRKRDNKPYKTEQSKVLAKKKKLNYHTTFRQNAPPGFHYLPVGTPDLAERCKELSRQRGLPVSVVNAKPVSRNAVDPDKVSHHIHRVGYHFRGEILDQACGELGYVFFEDSFVKEKDLAAQHEQSRISQMMAKFGIRPDAPNRRETDDQIRAAIKELFPKIPEEDLKEILRHAWEEGSKRVGLSSDLNLPRRVQLATIARIRHTYTDYDTLLRAFPWKEARLMVEPTCLAKLIEWRGEKDEGDDEELEEIVRETIVIDDDDDDEALRNGDEADDEGSNDLAYASDTSIEISHRPAEEADFGAESTDEHSRQFRERYQAGPVRKVQRNIALRQKIVQVREQVRNGATFPGPLVQQPYVDTLVKPVSALLTKASEVIRVHVPEGADATVSIGGRLFKKAPGSIESPRTPIYTAPSQLPQNVARRLQPQSPHFRPPYEAHNSPQLANVAEAYALHDRPIASIEAHEGSRRAAKTNASTRNEHPFLDPRARPASPDSERSEKRRRMDYPTPVNTADQYRQPRSPAGSARVHPAEQLARHGGRSGTVPTYLEHSPYNQLASYYNGRNGGAPEPYDPRQPLLPVNQGPFRLQSDVQRDGEARPPFIDAQVAPIQYMPLPQEQRRMDTVAPRRHEVRHSGPVAHQQPRVIYLQAPPPHSYHTPQPVHGAPAVVQQIPRTNEQQVASSPPVAGLQPPPAGYVPQPQYYYPR
ncbi:Hypothetical predicted protein [Lecanosticta acicola]|uniref:DUF2293 domain-containing protein n=1 Tax=Lecanosticta acicola TaxID=111012 RepID=A0AAI8YUP0_9PEZI|nr:Hypothetical predicted protein [Lecanosticta acicola]